MNDKWQHISWKCNKFNDAVVIIECQSTATIHADDWEIEKKMGEWEGCCCNCKCAVTFQIGGVRGRYELTLSPSVTRIEWMKMIWIERTSSSSLWKEISSV